MSCRWVTKDNKIVGALTKEGNKSQLFEELNSKYGKEKAVELYAVSESDDFKEIFGNNNKIVDTSTKKGAIHPSNSTNYANLTQDSSGDFVFYHVGEKGFKTIKRGTGQNIATSREEASALSKVGGMAMYYPSENVGESVVSGGAKYLVKVSKDKVYDFNADELNLIEQAEKEFKSQFPNQAFDSNTQLAFITKLANKKGFDVVVARWKDTTRVQTTKELKPIDFQELEGNTISKDFKEENKLKSNKDKGWKTVAPERKETALKNIYNKIASTVGSDYSNSLYKLSQMASYSFEDSYAPFKSQEEVTKVVMESTLTEELKKEYNRAISFEGTSGYSMIEEVSSKKLLNYIVNQNRTTEKLNNSQLVDLKDFLNFNKQTLLDAFYDENGLFIVDEGKLIKSGIYSQFEAGTISNDIELQATIKDSLERLKNTDEQDYKLEEVEVNQKTLNEFNSFGKLVKNNPFLEGKQEKEDTINLSNEDFQDKYGREKLDTIKSADSFIEIDGEIRQKTNVETELILPIVSKVTYNSKVSDLNNLPLDILQDNEMETIQVLADIEDELIKSSIDVIGLSEKPIDQSLKDYLATLDRFIKDPTIQNTKDFAYVSDSYFQRDLSPKKEVIEGDINREYVKLDTNLSEEEVYNQQGFIKIDDTTYIKTAKEDLKTLYDNLRSYTEKYIGTLEQHVQNKMKDYSFNNAEIAEAIILYKMYFNIIDEAKKDDVKQTSKFTGDYRYLTEEFPSDFYSKFLAEKKKNSKLFRDFYSNFEINEKGIKLLNIDVISLRNIMIYADDSLKQYSLLTNQMEDLTDSEEGIVSPRVEAINNIKNIEEAKEQSFKLNDNEYILKNTSEDFIRIGGDVYESVDKLGNLNHFVKLDKNESPYLVVEVEAPKTNLKLSDYNYLNETPEKFKFIKDLLKGENPEELNC